MLYDPEIYKQLLEGGVDQLMAQHVAHLFIRHHHYHLVNFFFKMTPQRHYFLVDGASKEIFFCSRDSVSMFTNKVKKDGDYDEVKNLISPVWNLKISKLFALG